MVSSTSLTSLAEKINQYIPKTGVTATVSSSGGRIVLESESGEDIKLYNFDFDNKSGKTISTRLIDKFSKPLGDEVLLGSTNGGTSGVSNFEMSGTFTNNQTAIFILEGSTFTYTANGNETAAQARDRLLTNPGSGEFEGTNGEIITEISSGVLQISNKDGKQLFKIESDGTTTIKGYRKQSWWYFQFGLGDIPPNSITSVTTSVAGTDLDAARYCGELLLRSSSTFTAEIAGKYNSSEDKRFGGLQLLNQHNWWKSSITFNSMMGRYQQFWSKWTWCSCCSRFF